MKSFVVFCALFAFVLGSPFDNIDWSEVKPNHLVVDPEYDQLPETQREPEPRITGGTYAQKGMFPYQVGMLINVPGGQTWCGGSLISTDFVLTAAHCVESASSIMLMLGAHDIRKYEPEQVRIQVYRSNFIIHEQWNSQLVRNDIALIKLPKHVQLNKYIQTIKLAPRNLVQSALEGQKVIASGWGRYSDALEDSSPILQYVSLPVTSQRNCANFFGQLILPSNICTNAAKPKSTCNGDSGGPLVVTNGQEKFQVGLTSFGYSEGCEQGWPAVFTRVTSYLDWISKHTGIKL